MRRYALVWCVASAALLGSTPAHAGEGDFWTPSHRAIRISGAVTYGFGELQRSSSSPRGMDAVTLGVELRVHPYSPHGFVIGYARADGIFGPSVNILDGGYSLRLFGSRRLSDVTGAAYVDVGPSFGVVHDAPPSPDHDVFGGRARLACDLQIFNVALGVEAVYRGGVPLGGARDAWEDAVTVSARAGLALDLGVRAPRERTP